MSNVDITERRVPQNGRITVRLNGRNVDLRTATLPTVWGEKVVLRVLDTGGIDLELKKLGFTDDNYARFSGSFHKPHGMVLVTGPTGSGKSTTLYATLTEISKPAVNIITVEDPVEYRLDGINQVQVNHKAGLNFAAVLPAILRSDPDIVLIGEIRDRDTAQHRGRGRPHRPPGAVHAAHQRRAQRRHPAGRDGHRAVPGRLVAGLRARPTAGPAAVRLVQGGVRRRPRRSCRRPAGPARPSQPPEVLWRPVGCRNCATPASAAGWRCTEVMPISEEIERLAIARASASEIRKVALARAW